MTWEPIRKSGEPGPVSPNLRDYEAARAAFSWEMARAELDGLARRRRTEHRPRGGRPARWPAAASTVALRWLGKRGEIADFTYARPRGADQPLRQRAASARRGRGRPRLRPGRAHPGALRRGARHAEEPQRLLPAVLGVRSRADPGPDDDRQARGARHHRVALPAQGRGHAGGAAGPASTCSWSATTAAPTRVPGTLDFRTLMARADGRFAIEPTDPEDVALLHFTSGTTGKPKGAVHVHEAVVAHHVTGRFALDLHPDDVFWCTADPGWVTGTSYGIIAPLTSGVTSIVDEAEFDAERWYGILQDQRVTRLVHRADRHPHADEGRRRAASASTTSRALRFLASVGEPLNPEAVVWGAGGLRPAVPRQLVADRDRRHHDRQLRRDGRPPGLDGAAAARHRGGHRPPTPTTTRRRSSTEPDVQGELALRPGWPSMFRGYLAASPSATASASSAAGT